MKERRIINLRRRMRIILRSVDDLDSFNNNNDYSYPLNRVEESLSGAGVDVQKFSDAGNLCLSQLANFLCLTEFYSKTEF